ncbi:hypothetical protein [Aquamicrobium sp. LC103]|uniref:hypothetical protein n=1 Tax=Aquamicrobium sp. LC103 TaxID=1120658 RepID=UPI00063E76D1|nr:hypothetical protein [Aquamicrobium sp. LC103]TKT69416.1 hypothetical protein XW59_026700 [Aquamicrobium sp. LC103]
MPLKCLLQEYNIDPMDAAIIEGLFNQGAREGEAWQERYDRAKVLVELFAAGVRDQDALIGALTRHNRAS